MVRANCSLFLLPFMQCKSSDSFYSMVLLGIETCFYDGMNAYGKTWLQFIFLIHNMAIIGHIIFISGRFSQIHRGTIQLQFCPYLFFCHTQKSYSPLYQPSISPPSNTPIMRQKMCGCSCNANITCLHSELLLFVFLFHSYF